MAIVVTADCNNCDKSPCVAVCPVECFYQGPNQKAIDVDQCIYCEVCIPECENHAIISVEDDDPLVAINRTNVSQWRHVS